MSRFGWLVVALGLVVAVLVDLHVTFRVSWDGGRHGFFRVTVELVRLALVSLAWFFVLMAVRAVL